MIKKALFLGIFGFLFGLSSVKAQAEIIDLTELERVYQFLNENLEGKVLASAVKKSVIEEGKLVIESSEQTKILDLSLDREAGALDYKMVSSMKRRLFKIDDEGNETFWKDDDLEEKEVLYSFKVKASTGEIWGYSFSKIGEAWGSYGNIKVEDGKLVTFLKNPGEYTDAYSSTGNGWKPAVLTTKRAYSVEDGLTVLRTEYAGYDFDLETRTAAKIPYAKISAESRELVSEEKAD